MDSQILYCSICGQEITTDSLNWSYGYNSFPVNEDRCCKECDMNIVLPRRMREIKRNNDLKSKNITKERSEKNVIKS